MKKSEVDERRCASTHFQSYLEKNYPESTSRSCSGVIRRSFLNRIVLRLKGTVDEHRKFRWYVKKNEFKLMDVPELSLHDVLVVPVKEGKEVSYYSPL